MKIGLYADPHFSQSSSIIVGKKGSFSGRLDNLIASFEWMNDLFKKQGADIAICLGDLTDKPVLTAEEITAMSKCDFSNHFFLVGNHCRANRSGSINSIQLLEDHILRREGSSRIHFLQGFLDFPGCNKKIYLLPYSSDKDIEVPQADIVLSHNDIKGYDFGGGHISTTGVDVSETLSNTKLFINGHLHNGAWLVKDRILNLGAMSGINFSSCGGQWDGSVAILDTETYQVSLFENPEAYKFRKTTFPSLYKVKSYLDALPREKNYVLQVKVPSRISNETRQLLDQTEKVYASRVLSYTEKVESTGTVKDETTVEESHKEHRDIFSQLRTFLDEKSVKDGKKEGFPEKALLESIIKKIERKSVQEETSV